MAAVFVVGENGSNELVINEVSEIYQLTLCRLDFNVKDIYKTMNSTLFTDTHDNIWIAGNRQLSKLSYFAENNIEIEKICSNACGECIFFISNEKKAYGTSYDHRHKFSQQNKTEIELIASLNNVIDIKSGYHCSIALCSSYDLEWTNKQNVIQSWGIKHGLQIPMDIFQEIKRFQDFNEIYYTDYNQRYANYKSAKIWHKMDFFDGIQIVKIECGAYHSMLLDIEGNVYCFGYNGCGQLGLGSIVHHEKDIAFPPTSISHFKDNNVTIRDIACGFQHNLALDSHGNIWSFGYNGEGQCGQKDRGYVSKPQLISNLKGYKISEIGCGGAHSFCKTESNQYFMFGDNSFNQCLKGVDDIDVVAPFCIDRVFKEATHGKETGSMYLGSLNTIFVTKNV